MKILLLNLWISDTDFVITYNYCDKNYYFSFKAESEKHTHNLISQKSETDLYTVVQIIQKALSVCAERI